jgi:hypothetical protein
VINIEQTAPPAAFNLKWDAGEPNLNTGPMRDRDSFYYRAIRTKLGDTLRAQYDLSEPLPEPLTKALVMLDHPKGLDLDDPEQRRRFLEDER